MDIRRVNLKTLTDTDQFRCHCVGDAFNDGVKAELPFDPFFVAVHRGGGYAQGRGYLCIAVAGRYKLKDFQFFGRKGLGLPGFQLGLTAEKFHNLLFGQGFAEEYAVSL